MKTITESPTFLLDEKNMNLEVSLLLLFQTPIKQDIREKLHRCLTRGTSLIYIYHCAYRQ